MASKVIKIEIPIETQDKTDPALGTITSKMENLDSASKKAQKSLESASKSAQQTQKSFENASKSTSGFEKSLSQSQKTLSAFAKEKITKVLEAKDKLTPVVKQALAYGKSFAGKAWQVTLKAVDLVTSPVRRVFGLLKSPLVAAGITISAGAGIADVVKTYAGFESAMSQVKAISGATGEEFAQLTAKAKEMGATTKFTAEQSAEAFNYMAMAGWKTTDMMSGIEGIMNLAAASGEDLGTTSDIVTDALTAFGLKAADSTHFADVLAQASANANTNVSKMGQTFQYVAPIAGAMGYSIEDTALAIGLMANAGIKGEKAGTALRSTLTRLADPPADAAAAMEQLGLAITNSDGSMRSLGDVMGDLRKGFSGLTAEQKTQLASQLAGQEAMSGLLAIVNASEEDYQKLADSISKADGAAKKMSDTMLDNLSGKWTLFKSALDGVKIALGERIQPYLMNGLEWLTAHMPDVEDALMSGMDRFDRFVDNTKEKIAEFTSSSEWANADIFGKMKISWDKLIAEPFSEWWEGTGQEKLAMTTAGFGKSLGTGISTSLLALLGVDVSSTIDEASSIGAQFAKGFASGFDGDAIKSAIGNTLTGAISNAASILPGGKEASLSSWLSAAMLARIVVPMLSIGGKGISLGKQIFGSGEGGLGLGASLIGSAAAGTGIKGMMASAGMLGINLGSGATSGAGLIAAGAGSVAGGLVAGGTLISGGIDAYTAYTSNDEEKKKAYGTSAGMKVGGVAAGAATGALIGSVVPVIGTAVGALIGAGLGGLAGWFSGNKVTEDYEAAAEAADVLKQKSKYALEGAKFDTKALGDAFKDTNVSAAEFGSMMQEATSKRITDSFGDIKMSVQDIKDAASHIVFGDQAETFTKFSSAANDANTSLSNLQTSISKLDKLNWKASMGLSFDETDISAYTAGIENVISSASQYLEDKHYEAKAAIDLLVEPGNPIDMMTGLNAMYNDLQTQVEALGQDLTAKVSVALEDGVITMDEQAEITNLQNQITDITNQISEAETEASFQSLKIKYSGAALDADSFASLVTEIQAEVQEAAQSYDEALEVSLTNLNLQLQNGAISQEQFDSQLQALTEGYQAKITELSVRVESFELQSIADAFGSELDGILPDLEGTVAERLGQAMHNAMANGVDVETWDVSTASKWLNMDGLSAETQASMTELMSQVAASLPEQMTSALEGQDLNIGEGLGNALNTSIDGLDLSETGPLLMNKLGDGLNGADLSEAGTGLQEGLQTSLNSSIENIDLSEAGNSLNQKLGESMSSVDMEDSGAGLQEGLQNSLTASLENVDLTDAATGLNAKLGEAMASVDMSESGTGIQEGIQTSMTTAIESVDLTASAAGLNQKLSEALSGTESVDMSGFAAALGESINSSVSGLDYSGVTAAVGSGISAAITASMSTIQGAITSLYSSVGAAINSAFAAGFTTTTTVTITVNYQLANPSATISFSGGGTGTATVSASVHANGGFVNGAELSWVGEDGPEAIIPLGSKRRGRGLELWKQAGEMLGIPQHAEGGILGYGNTDASFIGEGVNSALNLISEDEGTDGELVQTNIKTETNSGSKTEVQLQVNVNPTFQISGEKKSDDEVLRIIKTHMKELADDLGGELAERLGEVFSNMPIKGV